MYGSVRGTARKGGSYRDNEWHVLKRKAQAVATLARPWALALPRISHGLATVATAD